MIFDNLAPATVLLRWEHDRLLIVYCRGSLKKLDAAKAAMEGCETIDHLAADPDIAKVVTLEKLNAE
jgi:hypothetical protein